jgi:hypothetical protein
MHLKDLIEDFIEENSTKGSQHDQLQRLVASEREKAAFALVAPQAREAIYAEIIPQIEELVTSIDVLDGLVEQAKGQIVEGFKSKNPTYTRLIRYKSIDQSDQQYETDILAAMGEWARTTRETLLAGKEPGEQDKQEVTVKVEIEGADTVETSSEVAENLSAKSPETEDAAVSDTPPFDLDDVRL